MMKKLNEKKNKEKTEYFKELLNFGKLFYH